jgi:salicylate 5-hydroxylase small subunit
MIAASRISADERLAIEDLYAAYVATLDGERYDEWPTFFFDECTYRIVPRENWQKGLPLATLSFESRGMLEDRIYAVRETIFHEPYVMRHLISNFVVTADGGDYRVEANYMVLRTKRGSSEIFSTGRCYDVIGRDDDGRLRFKEKVAVFDNELIHNSLIYPI